MFLQKYTPKRPAENSKRSKNDFTCSHELFEPFLTLKYVSWTYFRQPRSVPGWCRFFFRNDTTTAQYYSLLKVTFVYAAQQVAALEY